MCASCWRVSSKGMRAEVETLAARDDRRRNLVRLGGGQHKDGVRRRLLQGLEKGIPGGCGQLVRLVDDVHAIATFAWPVRHLFAQVADVVNTAVRRGIDLDQVQRPIVQRGATQRAGIARVTLFGLLAVGRAIQDARNARLARPARSREQVRVREPTKLDRVAQRARDVRLSDDVLEASRAPAQVQGAMRLGAAIPRGGGRAERGGRRN